MNAVISYDLRTAASVTGVSPDVLAAAIYAGTLRAKRSGKNGGGKYLVTPEALRAWVDGLVDA
jgi:hypothetical protein